MKVAFIIQGEGRGHLTQAMAMAQILRSNKHTICEVLVGTNKSVEIPSFFLDYFPEAKTFLSPYLIFDKKTNKLRIGQTIRKNCLKSGTYLRSIRFIHREFKVSEPDLIINFYEGLGGLYNLFYNHRNIPFVVIAHQYLLQNPNFVHPKGAWFQQLLVNLNSNLTAFGADKKLCLSFTAFPDVFPKRLFTVPPLLRKEVINAERVSTSHSFLLIYVNQPALIHEIISWHNEHIHIKIRCFVTKILEVDTHPNLLFYTLDSSKFLLYMQECLGVVTTAGFETVCEAMYFQKPVLMIPMKNHYEQRCNALDAVRAKAGITQSDFNLSRFLNYIENDYTPNLSFRNWADAAEEIILEEIGEFEPKLPAAVQKEFLLSQRDLKPITS